MLAFAGGRSIPASRFVTLMLMTIGLSGLLLGCGWAIAAGYVKVLFLPLAGTGLAALAFGQRGAFIGLLLLAAMNGLPYVATSTFTAKPIALLALVSCAWIAYDGSTADRTRIARAISRCGLVLLLWWMLTVARTVVGQDIPIYSAVNFGRDFGFFALLLILLPRVRLTSRDIGTLLAVLTTGVCVFAVGQIMIATGLGQPGELIHFERTLQESGLTRVYTPMTDLIDASLALSIAACLIARQRRTRLIAVPVAAVLTVSVVVQLTRARWIGLVAGLVLVSLWVTVGNYPRVAAILRRRLAVMISALGIVALAVVLTVPSVLSGGTVIHRLLSIFTDLQTGAGTVAVRESVTATMKAYLGEKWLAGIGLVPPSAHYFEGLPLGSIRDSDLGALNAVTTMGVVGAVLIYVPIVLTLISCLRRSSTEWSGSYSWLRYGGAVWIVATLLSSVTLVTLFSITGLTLAAIVLTVLANPSVSGALAPRLSASPQQDSPSLRPAAGRSAGYRGLAIPTTAEH
jgi:hypothetical protein